MALSIKRFFATAADLVITSSAALVSSGLSSPIAANEKQKLVAWIPISVGATGGVRTLIAPPAGGTLLRVTTILYNTGAGTVIPSPLVTVFTNALANAGEHWLKIEATVLNGTTAGNVVVQIAQNTSDALSLTVQTGATLDVDVYTT